MAQVAAFADDQIARAVASLFPDEPVRSTAHVPSATAYVRRLLVGDRPVYAKLSVLGTPLVSLLRGSHGRWQHVIGVQHDYVRSSASLREAVQLAVQDRRGRPRVCHPIGSHDGVLVTDAIPGPSLGDLLLETPSRAGLLLHGVFEHLAGLDWIAHTEPAIGTPVDQAGITAVFHRTFLNPVTTAFLGPLDAQKPAQANALRATVHRLQTCMQRVDIVRPRQVMVYGNLTPEHVLYPDGPNAAPVFISPALARDTPLADPARLLSRTALMLLAAQPGGVTAEPVIDALEHLVRRRIQQVSGGNDSALRAVLTLWAMDTLNQMPTYLTAPADDLPLPPRRTRPRPQRRRRTGHRPRARAVPVSRCRTGVGTGPGPGTPRGGRLVTTARRRIRDP